MRVLTLVLAFVAVGSSERLAAPRSNDWSTLDSAVPDNSFLSLRIKVKPSNVDKLHSIARQVSNPQSGNYGHYLSSASIEALTSPARADVSVITKWLQSAGVSYNFVQPHIIEARVSSKAASDLLRTRLLHYIHKKTRETIVRAGDVFLPQTVRAAISVIYGMHDFPSPKQTTSMNLLQPNSMVVTPDVITKAYSIGGVKASGSVKNRQAVTQVLDATMDEGDLQKFFSKFVASAPSSAAEVNRFVPNKTVATFPRWTSLEAMLDIEYVMGLAPGLLTEFWWYGETSSVCPNLAKWSDDLVSKDDIPLVHSISYGAYEIKGAFELICPQDEFEDVELNLAKLVAKGITIIFASGDSGAGYDVISQSLYNAWPASSPWVTAVGATTFQFQKPGAEIAANGFGSGGGFSRYCNKSENYNYQASAVKEYLATASGLPPASSYAAGGRATPDVSACGQEIQIVLGDTVQTTFGTSASAPMFAAIVSLLNEARLDAGSPPMGFLNPFLYQNPDAFTDITVGNNSMDRGGSLSPEGFECAKGWDPVTGLGTPIFEKLRHAALAAAGVEAMLV